jgi:hypothetical protein
VVIAVLALVLGGRTAAAQSVPLREVIPTMLGPGTTIAPGAGGTHANDFARAFGEPDFVFSHWAYGPEPIITTDVRGLGFNGAIVEQLTRFPIGSSSGGFLYGFDPAVNTFTRTSRSFGSSYGERPLTSGRGTFSVGFTVQSIDFSHFDETDLDGGEIQFVYAHRDLVAGLPLTPERSDVMQATLRLKISSRTSLTTLTYGVTDRLDIGATIPFTQTTLEAVVDKEILRLGTSDPTVHSFDGRGSSRQTSTGGGTASGLGDVRVVAKYNFFRRGKYAWAVMQDFRLPTGDDRNLLGTGTLTSRTLGIFSIGNRSFAVNASIGTTFATADLEARQFVGRPSNELNFTWGMDYAVLPRVTVSADVVGHNRLSGGNTTIPWQRQVPFVRTPNGPVQNQTVNEFQIFGANQHQGVLRAIFGTKVNAWRNLLVIGNVLITGPDHGLSHGPALSFGAEYTF